MDLIVDTAEFKIIDLKHKVSDDMDEEEELSLVFLSLPPPPTCKSLPQEDNDLAKLIQYIQQSNKNLKTTMVDELHQERYVGISGTQG